MKKKRFEFYQDVKVKIWQRQHFTIEAETIEEARELAKQYANEDISCVEEVEVENIEWLHDTEERITPEENGGCATIEVFEYVGKYSGNLLADNAKKEESRKLIGYQIAFDDGKWPEGLYSFQVFRTEEDAQDYLWGSQLKVEIVPVYEDDVEDPAFIGKKPRVFKKDEEVCVEDDNGEPVYGLVVRDEETEYDEDEVAVKFHTANTELYVMAQTVYQRAEDKVCPRCGNPLYVEHHDEIDYPYYCPDCQENFYNFEAQ